jgi:hypothetical protein
MLGGCGESSSDANEPAGTYDVRVTDASFPTQQHLGQTSVLQLGFRNTGKKTVPALAVTISVAGKDGQASSLPFGTHDPQAGLAQADRPVWVLAATYPRLLGSDKSGGASTSNRKTFSFGPLKPGASTKAVWKLSAVRAGRFTLRYGVAASLSGTARARTSGDVAPGGSFVTDVSSVPPDTEVTDSGEVVEKPAQRQGGTSRGE